MAGVLASATRRRPSLREMFAAGEATQAMRAALARVKADGTPIELLPSLIGFEEFMDFIGLPEIRELEQRFAEG